MDPNLICPAILFLFIILLIQAPLALCQFNDSFSVSETCAESFSCGNIDAIGYPFWGGNQPAYCGHPSFMLDCNIDSPPEITILSVKYKVLGISSQAATIVSYDLSTNICPSNPQNTSLDFNLFSYAPSVNNITLFYGCTTTNPVSVPIPNLFNCSDSNKNVLWSPNTGLPNISRNNISCGSEIFVTVTQEAFEALLNASVVTEELLRTSVGAGFSVDWEAYNSLCDNCTGSGGRCGSNGDSISTQFVCYTDNANSNNNSNKTPLMAIGLCITGVVLLTGVGIGLQIFRQKRKWVAAKELEHERVLPVQNIEAFIRTKGFHATKLYTYSDIKKMTNSFNDKIGQGGFGSVYRGKLPDGCLVAVKLLTDTKGNGEDFINEVASISQTSHVNIVTLVGFCYQQKRALVYEFMPNGSLDKYIGNKGLPNMSCLEWKTLYQIAIGIARGLEYLHRGCNTRIMHFDIKPNNILLDNDFTPKISNFGLAKLCKKKESIVSLSMYGARGTIGYIAPEVVFRSIGNVSHKSDVYSYGMTVIDMVGVRENVGADQTSDSYFPNWIYEHLEQGLDFSLEGITNEEDKEMAMKMILVSLWCIQTNPADRPSIRKVVEMLEGSTATLQIPPKPYFSPQIHDSPQQSPTSSVTTEICGDISDVGYPFRSENGPAYCGYPGFELSCNEGNTTIDIMNQTYRVLEINQSSKTMKIAREDMMEGKCPQNFVNTTLDNSFFEYTTSYINLTFLYGCHGGINNIPGIATIPCGDINDAYVLPPGGTRVSVNCSRSMIVPVPVEVGGSINSTLLMKELKEGQEIRWKMDSKACDDCTKSKGRCGFSMFTNQTTCYCHSPPYISDTCSVSIPTASPAIPGLGIAGAVLAGVGIGWLIFRHKRKRVAANGQVLLVQNIEALVRTNGFQSTKLYTYSDIKKMTNSFSDKIGQGGFGSVYRGKLPDGCPVAVKLLTNTKGNGEDFINEVASISRTSHVNIVTLVGFCYKKKRALVYEFMPNGSLDNYIGSMESPNKNCRLEWKTLYQIAIGIARGLEYLHRGCNTRIMHFDIKPNNILLDKDFTPKISDFDLAKLCKKNESIVSLSMYGARGTIGYIAPEVVFRSIGSVSYKSDVYSYGMTVIDMVGVRENVGADKTSDLYFPNWIYEHLEQGLDFSLEGITDEEDKEMAIKMILVSLWCIQTNPADRPSIRKVVEMLEGSTATLQIPPKPYFSHQIDDSPQQSPTSSVTTEI
ncbi:uncharacterized protein LOC116020413 [Ipomoea triloba]|uniref:uncharacterized protein LOC116020413 n=1 Tax=Ipomoea triloba TaxID=35885 RepID=UPI00125E1FB1|nr:uncharacterized protein LOC116020413 [Ipomoea triloba]